MKRSSQLFEAEKRSNLTDTSGKDENASRAAL
jgi:hypothetical protein